MSKIATLMQQAAAGAVGEALAIEDVFSTYLYTGIYDGNPANASQTITNGIDLAGEGGLVWIKRRDTTGSNFFHDSERAATTRYLISNGTNAEANDNGSVTSFNSNGFTLGDWIENTENATYASWTFRKARRFFDVVTYTGTGSAQTIAHNLGTTVGSMIIKRTNTTSNWAVYHRGFASPSSQYGVLNNYLNTPTNDTTMWNSTIPDTDVFTVGTNALVNASGGTYVAYLFAHDPLGPSEDGSDGLISCGSFVTSSSATATIDLGWEPQWVLIKDLANNQYYAIYDTLRGLTADVSGSRQLFASASSAEGNNPVLSVNSKGFGISQYSSTTYIYIAIRRGPMREPESGTEVFDVEYNSQNGDGYYVNLGRPIDAWLNKTVTTTSDFRLRSRLTGANSLITNSTAAEAAQTYDFFGNMFGAYGPAATSTSVYNWGFRRAPGFFDVVAYTGTGAVLNTSHNLGVVPEMIWVKPRNLAVGWIVYHKELGNTGGVYLNTTTNPSPVLWWNNTTPTETVFTQGASTGNYAGEPNIAYLFATLAGVSKVGSYTGNGSSQTINCGFTGGARFVLIKRTDSAGDWYVWDTARGIISGNDPHLSLNTTAAEVTSDDSIDPDSSGFIVNQVAATNVNVSSASYIFLAIA